MLKGANVEKIEKINHLLAVGQVHDAAVLIREIVNKDADLKGNHIGYAHTLALDCDWDGVTRLLPPEMNVLETSGWIRSLHIGRPVDKDGVPLPWMNYAAIDFIGSKLAVDMRVFEWGAGYSSLWFASKVRQVVSVEDNHSWSEELKTKLPKNVELMYLPSQSDYVFSITRQILNFDVIVIDGSHRNDCARICVEKLSADGFIIFDNSDSMEYDDSMAYFTEQGFYRIDFWGLIPCYLYKNCTSILFRNPILLQSTQIPSKQILSSGISCFQAYHKTKTGG